ncbi:MAG TPA: acyltransferase [Chryseolinea sp.]
MTISSHKRNNFDFLRFLAASAVIYSHTYDLFDFPKIEPFFSFSHQQLKLSEVGVMIFFSISGYLVFGSAQRSPSIWNFAWKRMLRIYPGLIFVVIVSTLLLAFLSSQELVTYFSSPTTYTYLKNAGGLWIQYTLPGVFENHKHPIVNGSLWTIPYELSMYAILGVLFFTFRRRVVTILWVCFLVLLLLQQIFQIAGNFTFPFIYLSAHYVILFGYCFFCGALMQGWKQWSSSFPRIGLITLVLFGLSIFLCAYTIVFLILLLPPATVILGDGDSNAFTAKFGQYGDFSYGLYLFGFPVQQIVYSFIGNRFSIPISFFICLLSTLPLAVLSWFLVEKRFLKLKRG